MPACHILSNYPEQFLLQNDLFRQYQDAAGFQFKSQYYYLSWGPSSDINDLILGRYTKRTELSPEVDRAKFIYMPARIAPGGARTHGLVTLGSYKQ